MNLRPNKIRAIGLKNFLDSSKDIHNGLGYDDFIDLYVTERGTQLTVADKFNVSRWTMTRWVDIYESEKSHADKS
jgi:hypothetical protein